MKRILLLSLLVLQAQAATTLRDQVIPEETSASSDQSYVDALMTESAVIASEQGDGSAVGESDVNATAAFYAEAASSDDQTADASVTVTTPACAGLCPLRPLWNSLSARLSPVGLGVLSGVLLACMETELASPLLANCSDPVAIGLELGLFGALGYAVYTNEDNKTVQELKTPKALLGMLAGIIVWNSLHS
jgi:hypothetical protein